MADREPEILRDALCEHVNALAVDIGSRTPLNRDSFVRAANYIHSVFEEASLSVREQDYQYYDQWVTNVLATAPTAIGATAYHLVGLITTLSRAPQVQTTMRVPSRRC